MKYRRFGRTNIQMPVFSCGGMRYQYKWHDRLAEEIPAENQANVEAIVARALELGINHFETARVYGTSDRQLGAVLRQVPRERIIVQTKCLPTPRPAEFREDFMQSLENLGLDHVDLLSVHGINNDALADWTTRPGGCLSVARELQREGLVRHVGMSTHARPDRVLKLVMHEGNGGFDYVNLHYYWIDQRTFPAVREAARRDMGVFIISPSDKGGMLYQPPDRLRELTAPLHPMVFNDLFCLSNPEVHTLSVGAARPSDFDAHVDGLHAADSNTPALLAEINQRLRAALDDVAGPDYAATFDEGLPDWTALHRHINIRAILVLHMLAKAFDMVEFGKARYNLLGYGGHWSPGRNFSACRDETALFSEVAGAKHAAVIPDFVREAHAMLYTGPVRRLSATR